MGSKKEVLKFLSVRSIVIAAAKTGRVNTNKKAVNKLAQIKSGALNIVKPGTLIAIMVVIKFMEPAIEEIPAKCKLNIAKSTDEPS
jgi:hypothetical protein